ncbi:hypothetical protein PFISCL1PPCAC_28073, partial [Pristionchus fissidentatus]
FVSTPSPRPYRESELQPVSSLSPTPRAVYYEPAVHSIYGTDARRYTPVYERRKIEHAARLFEQPQSQVSPLRTVAEETNDDEKFVIRLTVGAEDEHQMNGTHDPHYATESRRSQMQMPTIIRSPSPAAAYVPQPKPRTKYALRQSASERDARFPSDFFRDLFPNQIQITRL